MADSPPQVPTQPTPATKPLDLTDKEQLLTEILNTENYDDVKKALRIYNQNIFSNNLPVYNQTDKSTSSNLRERINSISQPIYSEKPEYLGIILYSLPVDEARGIVRIYIDVPLYDFDEIPHPDVFNPQTNPNLDLSDWDSIVFYPVEKNLLTQDAPLPKSIARVRFASNAVSTAYTNPLDNKYLGTLCPPQALSVPPSTDPTQVSSSAQTLQLNQDQKSDFLHAYPPKQPIREEDQLDLAWRGEYEISCLPNPRMDPTPLNRGIQRHYALDVSMVDKTPIYAGNDFTVVGNEVSKTGAIQVIGHNDRYEYVYAHLTERLVKTGQKVKRGQLIGLSGHTGKVTGPHLHWQVRYKNGELLNILDFIKPGKILLSDGVVKKFINPSIPLRPEFVKEGSKYYILTPTKGTAQAPLPALPPKKPNTPPPAVAAKPATPAPNPAPPPPGIPTSNPTSRPKLLLTKLPLDLANGITDQNKRGSKSIYLREDIVEDIRNIKQILNLYNISLSCLNQDIRVDNQNISLLAKVGLEVKLNPYAGMSNLLNFEKSDYFISPDYTKPFGEGYRLKVYAQTRKNIPGINFKDISEIKTIDVYDVSKTYKKASPNVLKITKRLIDLSLLFEQYGFIQAPPDRRFFYNSDFLLSNWFTFFKPNKIVKGYTYKELLLTVYEKNNSQIWAEPDIYWDGNRFI